MKIFKYKTRKLEIRIQTFFCYSVNFITYYVILLTKLFFDFEGVGAQLKFNVFFFREKLNVKNALKNARVIKRVINASYPIFYFEMVPSVYTILMSTIYLSLSIY